MPITRHWRITGHSEVGVGNSEQTQQTHAGIPQDAAACEVNVVSGDAGDRMLEAQDPSHRPELHSLVASFHEAQGYVDPALQPATCQDEGFEDFRDFVNFIDGVGLSAQWTPEYDIDWTRLDQEFRRPTREPEPPHSPLPEEDIGTPFSTWLPSAPAENQEPSRSHLREGALVPT